MNSNKTCLVEGGWKPYPKQGSFLDVASLFEAVCVNCRHHGPQRVWKGGWKPKQKYVQSSFEFMLHSASATQRKILNTRKFEHTLVRFSGLLQSILPTF